jgi:hypothetical protein
MVNTILDIIKNYYIVLDVVANYSQVNYYFVWT